MDIRKTPCADGMRVEIVVTDRGNRGGPRQRVLEHVGTAPAGPELERLLETAATRRAELEATHESATDSTETLISRVIAARQRPGNEISFPYAILDSSSVGVLEVFGSLFDQFDFGRGFDARQRKVARLFRENVMHQLTQLSEMERDYAARRHFSYVEPKSEEKLHWMMDQLTPEQFDRLQATAATAVNNWCGDMPDGQLLNITSLYFGTEDPYEWGRSEWDRSEWDWPESGGREKPHRLRVGLALVVGPHELPIGYRLFDSTTPDAGTLAQVCIAPPTLGATSTTLVSTASGISKSNMSQLVSTGSGYIVGARLRRLPTAQQARLRDLDQYGPPNAAGQRLLDLQDVAGHRLIIEYDPMRARRNQTAAKRKEYWHAPLPDSLHSRRDDRDSPEPHGTEHSDSTSTLSAKLDGLRGIQTNRMDLSAQALFQHYDSMQKMKPLLRDLLSDPLAQTTCMWTPHRIRAHIAIGFVAHTLLRMLTHRVRTKLGDSQHLSERDLVAALRSVQAWRLRHESTGQLYTVRTHLNDLQRTVYRACGLSEPSTWGPIAPTASQ